MPEDEQLIGTYEVGGDTVALWKNVVKQTYVVLYNDGQEDAKTLYSGDEGSEAHQTFVVKVTEMFTNILR